MKKAPLESPATDATAHQVAEYVTMHLRKPNIALACAELNLARRTLQRRLQEGGTSFQKVVISTRIQAAKQLLAGSHAPITQIASDVGFATLQAFSSAFRRETGLSPSGYRSTTHKVPLMSIVAGQPVSGEVSALEEVVDASAPASQTRLIAAKDLSATG
jgi:AraC-like DNA-binding protein